MEKHIISSFSQSFSRSEPRDLGPFLPKRGQLVSKSFDFPVFSTTRLVWSYLAGFVRFDRSIGREVMEKKKTFRRKAIGHLVDRTARIKRFMALAFFLFSTDRTRFSDELTMLIFAVGVLLFYARKADRLSFALLIPYACLARFAGFLNWSVFLPMNARF